MRPSVFARRPSRAPHPLRSLRPRLEGPSPGTVVEGDGAERAAPLPEVHEFGLPALLELREQITARIEALKAEKEAETLETIRKLAAESGLSIRELIGKLGGNAFRNASGDSRTPKYRDPETGATWGGIGRKPNWVKAFEAQGGRLADIEILTEES